MTDKITESTIEQATLSSFEKLGCASIRDFLLPKLLSGEMRLKDAEKLVEYSEQGNHRLPLRCRCLMQGNHGGVAPTRGH